MLYIVWMIIALAREAIDVIAPWLEVALAVTLAWILSTPGPDG